MKKGCRKAAGLAVLLACMAVLRPVCASEVEDLQQSIDDLEQTQQELQNQIDQVQDGNGTIENALDTTQQQVAQLEAEKAELEANMKSLDEQLGAVVKELSDITAAEEAKQQEVDSASSALSQAEQTEKQQYDNMKLRIRYMYEEGSQTYLAVLFSAADASELLTRAEYISSIYKYDRDMLAKYEEAKAAVAGQKETLTAQYEDLEALEAEANEKKASMEALQNEKNEQLAQYNAMITSTQALADQYQQQLDEREALIAQLEAAAQDAAAQQDAALVALTQTLAQLENQERDAAEAAAAQAVLQKMAAEAQAQLEAAGESALTVDPNTLFVWPCPSSTRITSEYGYRIHPIYGDLRLHNGIDIGAETGSSIIAAYQGTVIGAGYNSSMGNYVMIDHGEGLVTIYMHASYLCVSEGDIVQTGQLIALVGATGDATGPHLHFTVRLNGNYVNPWNYVSSS